MQITLKAARINAGLNRNNAAKKLGVNPQTLARWENGNGFPNAKNIKDIEAVYNVNFNDLIFCLVISVKPYRKEKIWMHVCSDQS